MKTLMHLANASVIIILALAAATFASTGSFDPLAVSAAACAPLLCVSLFRWASRPASRSVKRK